MNCLRCQHNNPATILYCQKCGQKLDLTADEISGALMQKAQDERVKSTEFYAKQALFFSILIFVVALTLVILAGGAPSEVYAIPSATSGAKYVELGEKGKWEPPFERELCPFGVKRK
jgi:hypothetical protein